MNAIEPSECQCRDWACADLLSGLFGNGHNPQCKYFVPLVGAKELLKDLIKGIEEWGAMEDGIPDCVWHAYRKTLFIIRGRACRIACICGAFLKDGGWGADKAGHGNLAL